MPLQAIMLGAGNRGFDVYGRWALEHPDALEFVAVADADPAKLERFGARHGIALESRFADWRDAIAWARRTEPSTLAAFVCLPDAQHERAALACLDADLHLMLEKPVASSLEGTRRVAMAAAASSRVVMLGYVLRHTAFFQTLREVVRGGALGNIVTLEWRENVSSIHYAHSYVRGNWAITAQSSPMILAKCSHDLDLIGWITGERVARVSSFGGLRHFRSENAPDDAPERCLDGCPIENTCPFHTAKIYLTDDTGWPASVISPDPSLEARRAALEITNYGRCVYRCSNDVVDHQTAIFEFQSGSSATFAMHGHSAEEGRSLRIDGTKATLRGVFSASRQELRLEPHDANTAFSGGGTTIPIRAPAGMAGGGHGGGDAGLTRAFVDAVTTDTRDDPAQYLESHLLAFALERSKLEARVVEMAEFRD